MDAPSRVNNTTERLRLPISWCDHSLTKTFSFPFTAVGSLESQPTLPELLNLKTSSGSTLSIVQEIGTHYPILGPLLLNDDTGAVTSAIVSQYQRDADAINQEILIRWLQGQGKQPLTWSTLIGVVRDMELPDLAQDIQEGLSSSANPFGERVTH